jgi:hypothetical protein
MAGTEKSIIFRGKENLSMTVRQICRIGSCKDTQACLLELGLAHCRALRSNLKLFMLKQRAFSQLLCTSQQYQEPLLGFG